MDPKGSTGSEGRDRNTYGVTLLNATETQESKPGKRVVKYRHTARGFKFRAVSSVENGVVITLFAWSDPKMLSIVDEEDQKAIEKRVNEEVLKYVAAIED